MTPKRKKVQDYILKVIRMQDQTNYNPKYYEDFFAKMDDGAFDAWMRSLRDNSTAKIPFYVPPFKVNIDLKRSFEVAKFLGIKPFERLRIWDPIGKRYCLTPNEYLILRLPMRRLRQYLMDGLSAPESDKRLNPLTDQVVGPSKGSAISFPQAQMIAEKGLVNTLHEFMSIRGGDLQAYAKLKAEIEETGSSDTSVMEGTDGVRAVTTLKSFLNAMHLTTNI